MKNSCIVFYKPAFSLNTKGLRVGVLEAHRTRASQVKVPGKHESTHAKLSVIKLIFMVALSNCNAGTKFLYLSIYVFYIYFGY